jgi:hypothetical protein
MQRASLKDPSMGLAHEKGSQVRKIQGVGGFGPPYRFSGGD